MIKTVFLFLLIVITTSCSNIQLVLDDKPKTNFLKNNSSIFVSGKKYENFSQELFSYFGNNKKGEYIIQTTFFEKKENIAVKKNQVAEKIDYILEVKYTLFYKTSECKIFDDKITSRFSFTPKSAGYNFSADRSLDKLYTNSVRKNIQSFINLSPFNTNCL